MDEVILNIQKPKYFSFSECLKFLNRGYDECLYSANSKSVTRLIRLDSGLTLIKVSDSQNSILIQINKQNISQLEQQQCKDYVTDWFDLNRDVRPFYQLLKTHPQTKTFPEKYHGLRLMGIVDLFEALCWCVIGQQINLTFAHKIKTRLVQRYGGSIKHEGQIYYCFPTAKQLLNVDRQVLVDMQFSKQKINYVQNIAQAFCEADLNKTKLLKLDKSEQMKQLTAIKGIGPWTANYVAMKCLREMTCIAYGDTGLSSSLHTHFNSDKKPSYKVIDEIFKPYAGWESYLNFYLWRSLSD